MFLGRVIGSVVSTRKDERLVGHKFMVVQPLSRGEGDEPLRAQDNCIVSVDLVGAGKGEIVLVVSGSSARSAVSASDAPVDACIVGIVDSVEIEGLEVHYA